MKRHYFGTDGIRGRANSGAMTAEMAIKLGMAAGSYFSGKANNHRPKVVIAKDTRLSGYLLEPALTSGFISVGMDVILLGPLPTPAVAMLTRSMRADLGVMLSASHNPYFDNGIKLFDPDGTKLTNQVEAEIEALMNQNPDYLRADADALGRAQRIDDASGRYIETIKHTFPESVRLDGLRVVLDCAHGAAYKVAPIVLHELGAEVVAIGVDPNGFNINSDCGSTHPEMMIQKVRQLRADVGIALDGDADRVVICDEAGELLDGDQVLGMIAPSWKEAGRLESDVVVSTHMANLALEHYLASHDIQLIRTNVGDRYVSEAMREHHSNLGGEPSGHLIFSDYATTGDGMLAALQVLAVMQQRGLPLSQCAAGYTPFPQQLTNVRLKQKGQDPLAVPVMQEAMQQAEQALGKNGRIYIRASGTEPLLRIMVEGKDAALVDRLSTELQQACENALR